MSNHFNEHKFIDTVPDPSSVPEFVDGYSQDPTSLPEIEAAIATGIKDGTSVKLANFLRTKMFGADIRETLARGFLWFSVLYNRVLAKLTKLLAKVDTLQLEFNDLENKLDEVVNGSSIDDEIKLARVSKYYQHRFLTIGRRFDRIELENQKRRSRLLQMNIILEDQRFTANHEVQVLSQVTGQEPEWALVVAEIGKSAASDFHWEKVGEV